MDLLSRLPYALALAPLTLALVARDPAATARPMAAPADTVAAWRADMPEPMGRIVLDTVEKHGGGASGHFTSTVQAASIVNSEGRGGRGGQGPRVRPVRFQQSLNAEPYRGRRVRLSMWVRTRMPDKPEPKMPVSQTNVFMRIENEDGTFTQYDGSIAPIYGNTEWTRKIVVIEVPTDAYAMSFGVAVTGPGNVWVDDVVLDDQGEAMGPYQKLPMVDAERLAQMTSVALEDAKAMLARRAAAMKQRPAEVINGDFEMR
jgi:hypothetical protein